MAWPVVLSYLLGNAIELIDIAMVGRLGRDSVAAVGYAAQYYHVAYTLLHSIGIGCVALMARAIGAGELERARHVFAGALWVALGVAGLATAVVTAAPGALLGLLDAQPHVARLATPYFRLIALSSLLVSISLMFESGHRAQRNTRTPMLIAVGTLVVKTAGNALLMFGWLGFPKWGLVGAGVATIVSQLVAASLYLVSARWGGTAGVSLAIDAAMLARGLGRIRELLRVSLPAVGERLVMNVAILAYFKILSQYGTAAIAAYAIGVRLLSFSWIPGIAFGTAAATLVGQALGAGNRAEARRAGWRSVLLALASMTVLGIGCAFGRQPLSVLFTTDAGIIEHLLIFMLMLAIAQPFMGIHFTLSGALRGAGATGTPFAAAAVGNWVFRVPLAFLFSKVLGWSVTWVWAALVTDHLSRAIWMTGAFRLGRWARNTGAALGRPAPSDAP